jgi:hypothetical protein
MAEELTIPAVSEEGPEPESAQDLNRRWLASIASAQRVYDKWHKRGERITKRYRADVENDETVRGTRFNIFWSNVQTLAPATYSRRPKVEVSRRFRDQDPVGRLAAQILQRALQYEIDHNLNFHHTMQACVLDRLLPGCGVAWTRYEPSFAKETQEVPSAADPTVLEPQEIEVLKDEKSPVDYVYWKDFLISPARTWADARWVARRLMFTKATLEARFTESFARLGGDITTVPCDYDPSIIDFKMDSGRQVPGSGGIGGEDASLNRALVWEIWDKETKQCVWVYVGGDIPLDVVDDPAHLENFFPTPQPLFATMTNDTLVPVPDFQIYIDQIKELDEVSSRITLLVRAMRVVGLYDASQTSLQTLLSTGGETKMIPVNAWAAFAEKGGLKGVTDFVPIEMIAEVLLGLYKAREELKQTIYEITGMADIVRGSSQASETLGAQQIKAKFANLRLSSRQQQVAEFATGVLQIKAELMCEHYSPETLVRISAVAQLEEAQSHPERIQAAVQLLQNERLRGYRIEVAADSMVELDQVEERERRNDFMSTVANFFLAMKNIAEVAPPMMPVALSMLRFVVRGFSVGRDLEAAIEDAEAAIRKQIAAPKPPPPPTPEEVKMMISKAEIAAEEKLTMFKSASEERIAEAANEAKESVATLDASVKLVLANLEQEFEKLMLGQQVLQSSMEQTESRQHDMSMALMQRPPTGPAGPDLGAAFTPIAEGLAQGNQNTQALLAHLAEQAGKSRSRTVRHSDGSTASVTED